MIKTKEEQTIQWSKQKKNRQYNDQSKRKTDNTMIKTKEEQTMQWPKQKEEHTMQWAKQRKNRQYNGQAVAKGKEEQTIQ